MRPISEATLAILKSQNLTRQDKFNHQLMLEGTDYYSDVKENKSIIIGNNITGGDFIIRADGKVLFVYKQGAGVYLKIIESENIMTTEPYAVSGGTLFYTCAKDKGLRNATLIRLSNGKILLFIVDCGDGANSIPYKIMVYQSINGMGDDFTLKSIINEQLRPDDQSSSSPEVGKAFEATDGNLYIIVSNHFRALGYDTFYPAVYLSLDQGLTWSLKFFPTYGFSQSTRYQHLNTIIQIGNYIMTAFHYVYDGVSTFIYYSLDNGATWQQTSAFGEVNNISFFNGAQNELFLFAVDTVYKFNIVNPSAITDFFDFNNYDIYQKATHSLNYGSCLIGSMSPIGTLHLIYDYLYSSNKNMYDLAMLRDSYSAQFHASSISISKGRGGANTASIQASNKDGALNPKNPDSPLYGILGTNKQVIIKQGYGEELIETFTGLIDGFEMATWPQSTNISLRDKLKKALDQTVTYGTQHTIHFELQAIENIVGYLCYLAGIETGEIEATGIQVAKTFSWESYADCFQFLGDLASFEWGCDEYGKFYFRRDYQPDDMYVAYTFEEGVDISALKYTIKDDDLYYKVAVFGKSGDTIISYEAPFLDASTYKLMSQKILKIDVTEATTTAELQKIAERAIALMQSRTAVVNFTSIGVPWLQVGDFIGVYERSTGAAGIYRISSLKLDMDSDSFTMSIDAYYYGDSIVPGELPTEEATQTAAPSTNIIPEMTSNTAPSGVARASSVYTSAYEPWQAFNSTDEDLYWNAITNTGWIEYQFPEKMIVDKYSLKARQAIEYNDAMPKAWTFEGFDGAAWVVLDTRSAQSAWGINEVRTFLFANTTAYSKYRLNISANNGYNRLQLEQLAMYYGGGS